MNNITFKSCSTHRAIVGSEFAAVMNTLNLATVVGMPTSGEQLGTGPTGTVLTGPDLSVEPLPVSIPTVSLKFIEATAWDPTKVL